jgi:hypothetical protein
MTNVTSAIGEGALYVYEIQSINSLKPSVSSLYVPPGLTV